MDAAGLLAGGEYAIISVEEDEIYNPHLVYQYMVKGESNLLPDTSRMDSRFAFLLSQEWFVKVRRELQYHRNRK